MLIDIPGYENLYAADTNGKIWSHAKLGSGGHSGKYINPRLDKDGYLLVNLWKNKKIRTFKVHRLIAIVFLPNPNNLDQINHIDGIRTNNIISNLEWCDVKHNNRHTWKLGNGRNPCHALGEKSPNAKISDTDVELIRQIRSTGKKLKEISSLFNISMSQISAIANNKSRTRTNK